LHLLTLFKDDYSKQYGAWSFVRQETKHSWQSVMSIDILTVT